jgi:hypothetical protein
MGKRVTTAAGIAGFGSLLAGVGAPRVIEGLPVWVNITLFASGAVLIVAAFVSHLLSRKEGGDGGTSQTTHGPHSPNLSGTFTGPVTFGAAPAAIQERKSPYGSYDVGKLADGLDRVARRLADQGAGRGFRPKSRPSFPAPPRLPDLPLAGLLVRVYKKLGGAPAKGAAERPEFLRRVNLEIMDKVAHHKLHVWARFGERALDLITEEDWRQGSFNHLKNALHVPAAYSEGYDLTDLHFNRAEVERVWPTPLRTTNDGKP